MPGCGVHLLLARRILAASGDSTSPAVRAALLAGSLAPDMGYFPGGDRFISDLAHYHRSGQLAQTILRSAQDEICRAFARGWATHVLADTLIHPLINQAAGELVHGRLDGPLTFADDPIAHIRVEQGLDAVVAARFGTPMLRLSHAAAWSSELVGLLETSYSQTYGYHSPRRELWASCRALFRTPPLLLGYGRVAGWWLGEPKVSQPNAALCGGFATLRVLSRLSRRSLAYGFAYPVMPSPWLLDEVATVIEEFPERFARLEAEGLDGFPDLNLDTGEPADARKPYPPAIATAAEWQQRIQKDPERLADR